MRNLSKFLNETDVVSTESHEDPIIDVTTDTNEGTVVEPTPTNDVDETPLPTADAVVNATDPVDTPEVAPAPPWVSEEAATDEPGADVTDATDGVSQTESDLDDQITETDALVEDIPELDVTTAEVRDVTEHDAYEAQASLEDIALRQAQYAADDRVHQTDYDMVVDEKSSLESFVEVVRYAADNNMHSPALAAVIDQQLARYRESVPGPALESYSTQELALYYQESLEAFAKVGDKLTHVIKNMTQRTKDFMRRRKDIDESAKALNTQADALLNKMASLDDGKVTVSSGGLIPMLVMDGNVPADLPKAVAADQKNVQWLCRDYLKLVTGYQDKAIEALSKVANKTGDSEKILWDIVVAKTPAESVPPQLRTSGAFLNNAIITGKAHSARVGIRAEELGDGAYAAELKSANAKTTSKDITLTKADVQSLLKATKIYATLNDDLEKNLKTLQDANHDDVLKKAQETTSIGISDEGEMYFEATCGAASGAWKHAMLASQDAYSHIDKVSRALLRLCERAQKELEKESKKKS